tara:strand:- start:1543 stop:1836 length:294 start_codon:yes stop_codon:yes gene_type:complete
MKDTITSSQFTDEMTKEGFGFSYEGSKALFNYLTEYEESCDTELEFDPIAFRCDFDEYETLEECLDQYDSVNSLEELRNATTVIEVPNSEAIIIQAF